MISFYFLAAVVLSAKTGPLDKKKTNNTLTALHKLLAMASFNNCSAISSQTFNLTRSSFLHFCHPGADGAGVLRALAQAGVWNVFAPVQPTGWRPPALPLRLLLC